MILYTLLSPATVAYVRVSTGEQAEEGHSLEAQERGARAPDACSVAADVLQATDLAGGAF